MLITHTSHNIHFIQALSHSENEKKWRIPNAELLLGVGVDNNQPSNQMDMMMMTRIYFCCCCCCCLGKNKIEKLKDSAHHHHHHIGAICMLYICLLFFKTQKVKKNYPILFSGSGFFLPPSLSLSLASFRVNDIY